MAKTYVRIDDRLIHGQTIVAWCPALGIKEIIAIDDDIAKNATLKSIMKMGVPSVYKAHIVTSDEANELLSKENNVNRLVIIRYPKCLLDIKENIMDAESIILGNLAKREDTIYNLKGATGIFYFSDDDIKIVDQFVLLGMQVNFHQLPNASKKDWAAFKKTIQN